MAVPQSSYAESGICPQKVEHKLKPEASPPFEWSETIDVNLGHSPEVFIRAAFGQVHGSEPTEEELADYKNRLENWGYWRRTDLINAIGGSGRPKVYSDPWENHPDYTLAPCKTEGRDIGAVLMFFFNCGEAPWFTNCKMSWANSHAHGMHEPHALYGGGYYNPQNVAFWERELLDARYAGLSFFLPNVYGPDTTDGAVDRLADALENIKATGISDRVQVGMFDDTWGWGNLMNPVPDLSNTESAANQIFQEKWMPYFDRIAPEFWYRVHGERPLIYFYNAGTLGWQNSAALISRLKELFAERYGETPWMAVDSYFFIDSAMDSVADSRFTWKTLDNNKPENKSRSTMNGLILDHAMVRWDDIRNNEVIATPEHELHKGPEHLEALMESTQDADIVVLATWNDLGEGTGINRNYDYYDEGKWLEPDHFMKIIRNCPEPEIPVPSSPGDLDHNEVLNVADVQCAVLAALNLNPEDPESQPTCLKSCGGADLDCSGETNVVDVQLQVKLVLSGLLGAPAFSAEVDSDGDGLHDDCAAQP